MRAMFLVAAALVIVSGCDGQASLAEEKNAIVNLIQTTRGGSNADLLIEPVVVRTKYGVADWVQGDTGGRALVHKEGGGWKVIVAAGEEIRDADFLVKAGVPQIEAKALANVLIATERQVPEDRLAKFDRYGGAPATVVAR